MPITVFLDVQSTTNQYDQVMQDLAAAGEAAPRGRLCHVAQADGGGMHVVDIWDSPAAFERFAGVLLPILAKQGIPAPAPKIVPTHNFLRGA